jgi:hypothetical protein
MATVCSKNGTHENTSGATNLTKRNSTGRWGDLTDQRSLTSLNSADNYQVSRNL